MVHETVVDGKCGDEHLFSLTEANNVITFGANSHSQCSNVLDKHRILEPHVLDKIEEIGVVETSFIEKVMAINNATIVFITA